MNSNTSFETQVTKLFSQILSYQAQVVCQIHKNASQRYGRDVIKVNNRAMLLSGIKKQDSICREFSGIIKSTDLNAAVQSKINRTEELFRSQEHHFLGLSNNLSAVEQSRSNSTRAPKNPYAFRRCAPLLTRIARIEMGFLFLSDKI